MSPFKSIKGRALGKLLEGYKSSDIGKGFGSGGGEGAFTATGGTETTVGNMKFHYYNSAPGGNQTFAVTSGPFAGKDVYFLLVAGGGSGAGGYGGGGGGGGVVYSNGNFEVSVGSYVVTIGAGGAAPTNSTPYHQQGNVGSDSIFTNGSTTVTAKGGGYGDNGPGNGGTGGSGGGGQDVGPSNQSGINSSISGLNDIGNVGGTGPSSGPGYAHGGGGGAGEAGVNAPNNDQSGRGGAGAGPPTWPWLPTGFGNNGYFAGGGGGSSYSNNGNPGAGSPDGTGGAGGVKHSNNGTPGTVHTGGGGGAASTPSPGQPYDKQGGAGAGGAMIIAYEV